jgi:hypothetical protein
VAAAAAAGGPPQLMPISLASIAQDMFSYERLVTIQFCERWLQRAQDHGDSLDAAIDEFFSLFVAYNVLYTYAGDTHGKPGDRDRHRATRVFPQVVGYDRLSQCLNGPEGLRDLHQLPALIAPEGKFHLYHGAKSRTPNPAKDRETVRLLRSDRPHERIHGALDYIYQVRCNVFHGSKDLIDDQVTILRPCSRCLRRIIACGLEWLRNAG